MLKSFFHTGFIVKDIEKSIDFYSSVFGLTLAGRAERTGDFAETLLGYTGVHVQNAFLDLGDGHQLELIQYMTPRNLSKSKKGKCYYCPIVDDQGFLINDPVILKFNENKWWVSIADSDLLLFAKGLAIGKNFKVDISEANVNIMAVQGPKSFSLMSKVFGKDILDLKFYNFKYYNYDNSSYLVARSGWSKQGGFEIYVENDEAGLKLYDEFFKIGGEFNVKPGCPHLIERIESALLSYGNDIDNNDNPLECGFDKYVNLDSDVIFLGKEKLKQIRTEGINKKLMGVMINLDKINMSQSIELIDNKNNIIGDMRSAVFSPTFKKVIGIAMFKKPFWNVGTEFNINIDGVSTKGTVCNIPFV